MAEAVNAVAMADPASEARQVRTVVWVMSLALVGWACHIQPLARPG
jgi:hypothetical protein